MPSQSMPERVREGTGLLGLPISSARRRGLHSLVDFLRTKAEEEGHLCAK